VLLGRGERLFSHRLFIARDFGSGRARQRRHPSPSHTEFFYTLDVISIGWKFQPMLDSLYSSGQTNNSDGWMSERRGTG
jgi:hypothetical protein